MTTNVRFEENKAVIWQDPVDGNISAEPAVVIRKLNGGIAIDQGEMSIEISMRSLSTIVSTLNFLVR